MKSGHCFVCKPSVASKLKKLEKYYALLMELFHQEAQHVCNSMCQQLSALNSAYQQLNHSRIYYNLLEMTCDKMIFDKEWNFGTTKWPGRGGLWMQPDILSAAASQI